jgi:UPF0716 family protein affecting phage T7 exclusion
VECTNFENLCAGGQSERVSRIGETFRMIARIDEFVRVNLGWELMLWGVGVYAVSTIVGLAIVGYVLVKLPPTYVRDPVPQHFWGDRHPALRYGAAALKNALGAVLLVIGVILALPGVPGPGMLTMFVAVLLLDFPGKVRIVRWLLSRELILATVNRLRARFNVPPLTTERGHGQSTGAGVGRVLSDRTVSDRARDCPL